MGSCQDCPMLKESNVKKVKKIKESKEKKRK
jgi:hypothetical protein